MPLIVAIFSLLVHLSYVIDAIEVYFDYVDGFIDMWFNRTKEAINKRTTVEQLQFDEEAEADDEEEKVEDAEDEDSILGEYDTLDDVNMFVPFLPEA